MKPLRSVLFMPASNARAVEKARTLACDAVVLDLEDAVAPAAKDDARGRAVAAVQEGGFGQRMVAVRVNGLDTAWAAADFASLAGTPVDAVVLPKVVAATDLERARAAIGDGPALWAMIETAAGVLGLPAIVAAAGATRLGALIAGTNDLARDLRCRPDDERTPLIPALAQIVVAARAGGLMALDGVLNALDDADRLDRECRQGAMLGFDGKTLIHPAQIDAANRAFGPDQAAIARARRIVAGFASDEAADQGAIRLDGEMVERLHLAAAEQVLRMTSKPSP
ncbi:HpcH/HpaI aldolase/citrate lyase family protein [uncultured Sphingomonas sp.]|uniref:HpcH/HpaI aldolase/citrate lyase family protein n=1 Tax=uncultured Sphingomonas sp. TaxID=158754 RepID=UPI0035C98101